MSVTLVFRSSVLPRSAVPCLGAPRPSPAEPGITSSCPGATSGFESPHVGLRGLEWVGWGLFLINSTVHTRARTHAHTIWGLPATERDNDPERCKFTWCLSNYKTPSPAQNRGEPWRPEQSRLAAISRTLAGLQPRGENTALSRGPQGPVPSRTRRGATPPAR